MKNQSFCSSKFMIQNCNNSTCVSVSHHDRNYPFFSAVSRLFEGVHRNIGCKTKVHLESLKKKVNKMLEYLVPVCPGEGACYPTRYRCLNKKDEKGYFFRAWQCTGLPSFRVGTFFVEKVGFSGCCVKIYSLYRLVKLARQ